jgi:DNA phosphorothioation-dependent restriction protein DptG
VDAETISTGLLDTTKASERSLDKESKEIEKVIEKKTKSHKFIKKLKNKLKLVMIEDEGVDVRSEEKANEIAIMFEKADDIVGPQPEPQIEVFQEMMQFEEPQEGQQAQEQEEFEIIPLIKKRGRKPKKLVIQEEIPLEIENLINKMETMQLEPIVKEAKKRGRPKKVV